MWVTLYDFSNACYFFAEVIYQQAGVKFVEAIYSRNETILKK
ncbi:hypothetical protein [Klebsiella pneumoniae IS22]|nr:hypothetical protein [Klebsiella pneumoniae IS22]